MTIETCAFDIVNLCVPLLLLILDIARGDWGGVSGVSRGSSAGGGGDVGEWAMKGGSSAGGGGDVGEWAMKGGSSAGGGGDVGVVGVGEFLPARVAPCVKPA